MKQTLLDIKKLIAANKIKEAFEALEGLGIETDIITVIKAEFTRIQKEYLLHTLSHQDYTLALNNIHARLTKLIDNIIDSLPQPVPIVTPISLPPIDLNTIPTAHCLRKGFSEKLIKVLFHHRRNLNLTGNSGQGKSRQLKDIKDICTALQIHAAFINLKDFRLNYELFLKSLATQLHLQPTNFTHFTQLLDVLLKERDKYFLIMIDNLEILNDYTNNNENYNTDFVSSLNFLKNNDNTLLICTSREWLKEIYFNIHTSSLGLHKIEIPHLQDIEIEQEICRRCPEVIEIHREQIRKSIRDRANAYYCLETLLSKMVSHYDERKFSKTLLTKWLKELPI